MQKIKSGDGYFDVLISNEDHAVILLALEGALAQIGVFNDPFDPIHPKDFETAINIFKNATKQGEHQLVIREYLFPYMDTEIILKKLSHYLKSGQMVISGLEVNQLHNVAAAFSKLLPKGDVPPHLYPKEYREVVPSVNKKEKHK